MKNLIITFTIICISSSLFGQEYISEFDDFKPRSCISLGVLHGGGSLIGADIELLLSDQVGVQAGAGFRGFGAGLNYHFEPSIRSSFLSFQYWHQGLGDTFAQSVAGINYVHRGRKWFTFTIGAGVPLEKGPAMSDDYVQPPIMLTYAIGIYIPSK